MQPNERQCAIHRNRALRFFKSERIYDATLELKEALSHDPRDAASWKLCATIYAIAGYLEQAASYAQKAVSENYEDIGSWTLLMNIYAKIGGPYLHLVLEQYLMAKDIGESSNVHYLAGNAYLRLDNKSKAVQCYERALDINPDHKQANREIQVAKR